MECQTDLISFSKENKIVLDAEEIMQKVWGGHGTGSGEDTGWVPQRVGSLGPTSCLSVLMTRTVERAEPLLLAALRSERCIKRA